MTASFLTSLTLVAILGKIVNPRITGQPGKGMIELQLAFEKSKGLEIISRWGSDGIIAFNQLIFVDYLYPVAYSIFFASLYAYQAVQKKSISPIDEKIIYLPFIAGFLDWIENTMELFFVNSPQTFSNELFFTHSIIALIKWVLVIGILLLTLKQLTVNFTYRNK